MGLILNLFFSFHFHVKKKVEKAAQAKVVIENHDNIASTNAADHSEVAVDNVSDVDHVAVKTVME